MAGDRFADRWVDRGVSEMARATSALVLALAGLALACSGGFETPDLESGSITGRLLNASAGAYVYPFGRPDLRGDVDADGRFSLEDVPVEITEIVVVAPDLGGRTHAQVKGVNVEGADRIELPDMDVASMPFAGMVMAAAQPAGGATAVDAKFTAVGTDQAEVLATSGTAVLAPLPPGRFEIRASMEGFQTTSTGVQVEPATTMQTLVPLPVDPQALRPGCAATGLCRNGLVCNPKDGSCYECVVDDDCSGTHGTGSTCSAHACQPFGTTSGGNVCDACTTDGDCLGTTSGACVTYGGSKFCSETYAAFACPAGFAHVLDEGITRDVCAPLNGCAAYRVDIGSACFQDSTCSDIFLMNPPDVRCESGTSSAGYCTGSCMGDADCIIPGWTCSAGMGLPGYCVAPTGTPPV